ncbi:MAG: hypothetical protein ACREDK_06835 [Thermoplasmata archaeon]
MRNFAPRASARSSRWGATLGAFAVVVLLTLMVPSGRGVGATSANDSASSAAPTSPLTIPATDAAASATVPVSTGSAPASSTGPSVGSTFNPPCYKVDTSRNNSVCVSIKDRGETQIVPVQGGTVCPSQPNSTESIPLIVKSHVPLNWTGNPPPPKYGPNVPVAVNVTAVLWNGDPYYSQWDGSVWHAASSSWWTLIGQENNLTYPWWYEVNLSARSSSGAQNFFPGMTITWWIYTSMNESGRLVHHEGPKFQCTYSGAWPYSPYHGTPQYAGASAIYEDTNLTVQPRSPNWNDTVKLVLNTTQADVVQNATIGRAYVDLNETLRGTPILNGTIQFPVQISSNAFGQVTTTALLPASYQQVENATVTYQIYVFDVYGDQLEGPLLNYVVGGNGSFASGVFVDDLEIDTSPNLIASVAGGAPLLNPGQPVNVTLVSRNPGTAINFAEIAYTLGYPQLNERISAVAPLVRESSTLFTGRLPGFPIATDVNFSVLAWDFQQRLEVSPQLSYAVPTFDAWVPLLPANETFFYVYVYDNGTGQWVTNAKVQIEGPHHYYNIVTNTTLGVAYPNLTRFQYLPLLLPANATYVVTVDDPMFMPPPSHISVPVNVSVLALHTMTTRQTLAISSTYIVVQEGDAILFYLNASAPPPVISPSTGATFPLAGAIGLIAAVPAAFVLYLWWSQIRERRRAEEKRVTL